MVVVLLFSLVPVFDPLNINKQTNEQKLTLGDLPTSVSYS